MRAVVGTRLTACFGVVVLGLMIGGCQREIPVNAKDLRKSRDDRKIAWKAGLEPQRRADNTRPPNIVLIVADDLGYGGLGCYGSEDLKSPQIDSLAREGMRFTDAYVTCPVCSPSRAGMLTGRYQGRFGHEFNPDEEDGLPLDELTMADLLQTAGYTTGVIGKWHLGMRPEFSPQERGFDEFFGFLNGSHIYYGSGNGGNEIRRGSTPVDEKSYLTDAIERAALEFIDRHAKEPFFLYLSFNAVHDPMEATPGDLNRVTSIPDPTRRTHAAMLLAMDDAVGAVMSRLREEKLDDNSIVFFISDNGGATERNTSRNDPLNGKKSQLLEGGIRVPFMIRWPGHIPAGTVYPRAVSAMDILPTALAAAGAGYSRSGATKGLPLDGINLLPFLSRDNAKTPHDALCWRYGRQAAIRKGNWKLVRMRRKAWRLYNLASDIGESTDLADERPELVAELSGEWDRWNAQLIAPRWDRR